ncbi:MAG TPA: hypothetical protein DIV79_17230 [Opitutae bacterium]|nr:hypothetical protein [Opitutaceae bacterium]HCR31749.1 hypothetical protein [Opitutae bacterium]|tara:strand:+ start:632 stop:1924 length:1293 start_codon:yes stop_codon:yes gene_type:complete
MKKEVNFNFSKSLSRRTFLKGAGAAMALPWLEAMTPAFASSVAQQPPRRFVAVTLALGLHGPNLNPTETGRNYTPSLYLSEVKDLLGDMTVVTGSSHPGVSGGHQAEGSILTAAPYSRSAAFKNSISLDQYLAKHQGHHTRFPSLVLDVNGTTSSSYTDSGSMIPAEISPSRVFNQLFIPDTPEEQARQVERLKQGRSIMDVVASDAKRVERKLGKGDREKMDQYFTSVRNFEKRLGAAQNWATRPKPKVNAEPPVDIENSDAIIDRKKLMLDVMFLALQTDSTRFITLHLVGEGGAVPIDGVDEGYHTLSHHGLDEEKLKQLTLVESGLVRRWGDFLRNLKGAEEANGTMLDTTSVLMTSNLGNGSSHDNRNMPVLLAGGGFKHGQHLAFDKENNYPLPNLFLSVLHRHGIEADQFATSTGTMTGLEMV